MAETVTPFEVDQREREAQGPTDEDLRKIEFVRGLVSEAARDRSNRIIGDRSIQDWWQFGIRRYLGDHHDFEPREGMLNFTLNRDQVAVVANVADQTAAPIRPRFTPVEEDDEPIYFVSRQATRQLYAMKLGAEQTGKPDPTAIFEDEQLNGEKPLRLDQVQTIRQMARPIVDPATGQIIDPPLDHKAVIAIDDRFRADLVQKVFDAKWKGAQGDDYVAENELIANVFGHAPMWAEVTEENWSFDLSNPNVMNVLVDPTNMQIPRDSAYCVIKEHIGLDRAKELWPHLGPELDRAKVEGRLESPDAEWVLSGNSTDVDYHRPMVTVLIAYMRDFSTPLAAESAIEGGFVEPALDENDQEIRDDKGVQSFVVSETGALTTQGDDIWPRRTSLRVMKIVDQANFVVFDEPLRYRDFPIGWNKNVPIPFRPWGLPESQRTKDVQDMVNWLGQIILNHMLYYQFPQEVWPKTLLRQMEDQGVDPFVHPGQQVGIDDADFREWVVSGKLHGFAIEPPKLDSQIVNAWIEIRQEHELMSGYAGVRQGTPPTSDASGVLVQELVAQAGGVVSYKARFTERMVNHIAGVLMQYLVENMPTEDWHKYATDLSPAAFAAVWSGMDNFRYDVITEIGTGRGSDRQREEDKALENLQAGLASRRTTRIKRDVADPDGEERQIVQERQVDAQQVQPAAQEPTQ